MFDRLFDTNHYHTTSALEIEQRVRQREEQRSILEAEYGTQPHENRKPARGRLTRLLTSLFAISI